MAILCALFGHKHAPSGWWGDIPYVDVTGGAMDGIGRIHGELWHECVRCGQKYMTGRIHFTHPVILEALNYHFTAAPKSD